MSVSSILEAMAANAGRGQIARGALIGNTISNVAAIPGQIMDDREKQAVIDAARQRLANQDARGAAQDARQAAGDARDQAAAQAVLDHTKVVNAGLAAAIGDTGDPTAFDGKAAFAAVSRLGHPEAISDVIAQHRKLAAPITQEDPTKDTYVDGVLTKPGVAKPPEMGTPAFEVYTRQQELLHPTAPPASAPGAAPGGSVDYTALTTPAPADHAGDPSWTRADGTPKGNGFLGVLKRPDGKVSSEISIGVLIDGKETEVPTLVPTLTSVERNWLLTHDISDPSKIPMPIQQKAIDFAKTRIAAGKSPFAGPDDVPAPTPPALTPNAATLQAYADQRAATKPPVDAHSPIYKEWKDYTSTGGTLGFDAYMNADANRKRPVVNVGGMTGMYNQTDPKAIAAGIRDGSMPPDISQYGRPVQGAIATELQKNGFNLSLAQTDWKATQKHIASMNSTQQLKLNQSINALPDLFDSVDSLASQWHGGRFPILNKANLALAKGGAYGSDVASVARQLDTQIADTTSDLGVVYMGGNSPTDHALHLAATALAGDWDEKVLHDMVKLGKSNALIRSNSIKNTGVAGASADNPYGAQPAAAAAAAAPSPTLAANATHRVVQNGVTYDVTTDASGKVVSSKAVKP